MGSPSHQTKPKHLDLHQVEGGGGPRRRRPGRGAQPWRPRRPTAPSTRRGSGSPTPVRCRRPPDPGAGCPPPRSAIRQLGSTQGCSLWRHASMLVVQAPKGSPAPPPPPPPPPSPAPAPSNARFSPATVVAASVRQCRSPALPRAKAPTPPSPPRSAPRLLRPPRPAPPAAGPPRTRCPGPASRPRARPASEPPSRPGTAVSAGTPLTLAAHGSSVASCPPGLPPPPPPPARLRPRC